MVAYFTSQRRLPSYNEGADLRPYRQTGNCLYTLQDILIADRYRIDRKIGAGGFGLVYSSTALSLFALAVANRAGTDLSSGEEVAIKLTFVRNNPEVLRGEKETYEALNGGVGIPQVR